MMVKITTGASFAGVIMYDHGMLGKRQDRRIIPNEVRIARLCFQMLKTSRWSPRFADGKVVKPSSPIRSGISFLTVTPDFVIVMPDLIGHPYPFVHLHIYTFTHMYRNI